MLYVWVPPEYTVVVPCGDIDPPLFADAVIVKADVANEAVALRSAVIAMAHVEEVPEHAPDQPENVDPEAGDAASVTTVPDGKEEPLGELVTVPDPVPPVFTVSA